MSVVSAIGARGADTIVRGVHVGHRDHYRVATEIIDRGPSRVVLMQRSSTLVLGPEQGWDDEAAFYDAAWRSIGLGTEWFHVASAEGIARHLARAGSVFARRGEALRRLTVGPGDELRLGSGSTGRPVKQLPPDRSMLDYKLDRQARMVSADFDGSFEAIVVVDVGDHQCSIHQCGPLAEKLFTLCLDFWASCPTVTSGELTPS
ncbi:MAG: hypothetical protein AAFP84_19090 [Actinomycetota bacterium]